MRSALFSSQRSRLTPDSTVVNLNPAQYPALDVHAPADSSTVRQWISEINLIGAPNIPINGLNGCQNATFNAAAVANASSAGTCQSTRPCTFRSAIDAGQFYRLVDLRRMYSSDRYYFLSGEEYLGIVVRRWTVAVHSSLIELPRYARD